MKLDTGLAVQQTWTSLTSSSKSLSSSASFMFLKQLEAHISLASKNLRRRLKLATRRLMTTFSSWTLLLSPAARLRILNQKTFRNYSLRYWTVSALFGSSLNITTQTKEWRVCWPKFQTRSLRDAELRLTKMICSKIKLKNAWLTSMKV